MLKLKLSNNKEPELWLLAVVGDSDEFAQNVSSRFWQAPFFQLQIITNTMTTRRNAIANDIDQASALSFLLLGCVDAGWDVWRFPLKVKIMGFRIYRV